MNATDTFVAKDPVWVSRDDTEYELENRMLTTEYNLCSTLNRIDLIMQDARAGYLGAFDVARLLLEDFVQLSEDYANAKTARRKLSVHRITSYED